MGIGTGRPGIADQLRDLGLPVVPASQRSDQVRDVVTALRELDGADRHTPVAMAVGGPKAQALAAELADTVTFVMPQIESRARVDATGTAIRRRRDVELALHVPVIGDSVAPFMAGPDPTPPPSGPQTRWPFSPATPRPPPRRSSGDGRRSVSRISCSAPMSPALSPPSSPSWPDGRPSGPRAKRKGVGHRVDDPSPNTGSGERRFGVLPAVHRTGAPHTGCAPPDAYARATSAGSAPHPRPPPPGRINPAVPGEFGCLATGASAAATMWWCLTSIDGWYPRSFVLTDIVDSVSLWERDAEPMSKAVARYDAMIGREVDCCRRHAGAKQGRRRFDLLGVRPSRRGCRGGGGHPGSGCGREVADRGAVAGAGRGAHGRRRAP